MTILMPEGSEWDQPVVMKDDPFTYFVENERSIQKLADDGMPQHCIREIRQDTDDQLIDWHRALVEVARRTGITSPKLFGWGDIDFVSTTEEQTVPSNNPLRLEVDSLNAQLTASKEKVAELRKRLKYTLWGRLATDVVMVTFIVLYFTKR